MPTTLASCFVPRMHAWWSRLSPPSPPLSPPLHVRMHYYIGHEQKNWSSSKWHPLPILCHMLEVTTHTIICMKMKCSVVSSYRPGNEAVIWTANKEPRGIIRPATKDSRQEHPRCLWKSKTQFSFSSDTCMSYCWKRGRGWGLGVPPFLKYKSTWEFFNNYNADLSRAWLSIESQLPKTTVVTSHRSGRLECCIYTTTTTTTNRNTAEE